MQSQSESYLEIKEGSTTLALEPFFASVVVQPSDFVSNLLR